jgi:hypothetical protein
MRGLIFLAGLAIIALIVTGVIHIQKSGNQVNITVDEVKLKQEAGQFLHKVEDVVHDAEAEADKVKTAADAATDNQPSSASAPIQAFR